jgi:predicted naringenin-chalcone synthase
MSSATILFVLEEILRRQAGGPDSTVCAVAFGPGLTVEMATLSVVPSVSAAAVPAAGAIA